MERNKATVYIMDVQKFFFFFSLLADRCIYCFWQLFMRRSLDHLVSWMGGRGGGGEVRGGEGERRRGERGKKGEGRGGEGEGGEGDRGRRGERDREGVTDRKERRGEGRGGEREVTAGERWLHAS